MRIGIQTTVATAIAIGVLVALPGGSPAVANYWIDTNGGTCTRQSTAGAYVDAQACASVNAVYTNASAACGDTVNVKGGTYGVQTISSDASMATCTSNYMTVREASGETAVITTTWGDPSLILPKSTMNLNFQGLDISWIVSGDKFDCSGETANVKFTDTVTRTFWLNRVRNWTWDGGEVGPAESTTTVDAHPILDDCGSPNTSVNYSVLFDGVYFHDVYTSDPDLHTECLLVTGADGLTIQNSRFFNCDSTGDLYITRWNFGGSTNTSQGVVQNVLVQNNMFMDDTGYTGGPAGSEDSQPWSIQMDTDAQIDFINNTWTKSLLISDATNGGTTYPSRTITFRNNYASTSDCGNAFTTFSNNVWHHSPAISGTELACDGSLQGGNIQVVDRQTDLHLSGNSTTAKDAASATYAPATDYDGDTRPIGAADDAGADEKS